jgi:hypothetical protein
MLVKFAAILLVFFGEVFSIGAELIASKRFAAGVGSYLSVFLPMFLLITVGGGLLVGGYMLGYTHLKNIWIITALSVGSILIVEPIMAFLMFQQLPTLGAGIGLCLGALGILAALFF